jgi:hypothetical protein
MTALANALNFSGELLALVFQPGGLFARFAGCQQRGVALVLGSGQG